MSVHPYKERVWGPAETQQPIQAAPKAIKSKAVDEPKKYSCAWNNCKGSACVMVVALAAMAIIGGYFALAHFLPFGADMSMKCHQLGLNGSVAI